MVVALPGNSNFTVISSATSSSYTTPAAVIGVVGHNLNASVTNNQGLATSTAATLTVLPANSDTDYVISTNFGNAAKQFQWMGGDGRDSGKHAAQCHGVRSDGCGQGTRGSHTVKDRKRERQGLNGASVTFSMSGGVPGSFVYGNLPNPVTLNANMTYYHREPGNTRRRPVV